MDAVYKLNTSPANFNFLEFLVSAKTLGATSIVIDNSKFNKKYPVCETVERLESIVEPACALAGLPFKYGVRNGTEIDCGYHMSLPIMLYKKYGRIEKLSSVLPKGTADYTITLRNYYRDEERNSNEEAWLKFADEIGAVVIRDWCDEKIHLHDRMALYAGAKMNFFTNNGPAALCVFSDYPYTLFVKKFVKAYHDIHWPENTQVPWANENQRTFWQTDSYENIRASHVES